MEIRGATLHAIINHIHFGSPRWDKLCLNKCFETGRLAAMVSLARLP
jgi:hypothetical protein